jgi:glycine/D-amino acid oxidase-like deaminating enzyme
MSDAIVVGGGIFGATAALELAERGWKVTLLDAGPMPHPDAASTDISKVVRLDYGGDSFYTELMERALPLWRETFGGREFHETGFTLLSSGPLVEGSFEHASFQLLTARGHRLERLDARAIERRFGVWRPGTQVDGYHNPEGGWAESARVVAWYVERARQRGVSVRAGVALRGLETDGDRVVGVRTDGGKLAAACTVLACGAWTPIHLPELADRLRSTAQPVVHFRPADPEPFRAPAFSVWAADIARTGWYGFPAQRDGIVKIAHHGSGTPLDARAPRPPPKAERFTAFIRDRLVGLAGAAIVERRLCLYCDSFDGDFFIDRHPARPGLVVAAGGSGHGFKFAPLLGGLVADAVQGASVLPRFAWRTQAGGGGEQARARSCAS